MKKVLGNQMRVVSADELKHVSGGSVQPGGTADKVKNIVQQVLSGSRGCVAGAQGAGSRRGGGRRGKN